MPESSALQTTFDRYGMPGSKIAADRTNKKLRVVLTRIEVRQLLWLRDALVAKYPAASTNAVKGCTARSTGL